jgi:plasmid stabilization system protein ParE
MKYRIVLSPGASADLSSVARWYLNIDQNLVSRFLAEIDTTLRRIRRMPYAFAVRSDALRRARLKRFPYLIYYYVKMNVVVITAILHERRSDPPWITRARWY